MMKNTPEQPPPHISDISTLSLHLPNGVAQTDSSSVDVYTGGVNVQHLDVGEHDHTERLIDLPHGDILRLHTRRCQHLHADMAMKEVLVCLELDAEIIMK